ncbi:MAG: hypothetical protein FWD74_00925 [Actinomycetia bacterium]|nr:hypothetical protein [Actinomycetes bacterium]
MNETTAANPTAHTAPGWCLIVAKIEFDLIDSEDIGLLAATYTTPFRITITARKFGDIINRLRRAVLNRSPSLPQPKS